MRAVLFVMFRGEPGDLEGIREEIDRNDRCCLSANDVVGDTLVIEGETRGYIPLLIRDLAEKYGCTYGFEHEWVSNDMCESYDPHGILPGYWCNDCLVDQYRWGDREAGSSMTLEEALDEINERRDMTADELSEALERYGNLYDSEFDAAENGKVFINVIANRRLKEEEIRWETREMASIDYMKCRVCGCRVCYWGGSWDIWNQDEEGEERDTPLTPMVLCPDCEQKYELVKKEEYR